MNQGVRITTIVEDTASGTGLIAEHGLSFWIEYASHRILFDTGQSNAIIQNAIALGIDLANADSIVISHGHYDHTGGLQAVLDIAAKAMIYLHPTSTKPKFSQKASGMKSIGISDASKKAIQNRSPIWTVTPAQICTGITVTGQVPRTNDFENIDEAFFLDEKCQKPDGLLDDQTLFIESSQGLIVVFGCAHSGVVNTLDYISRLTNQNKIYAIIGGMHLLNASQKRIENTIETFNKYEIQKIIPLHCTGRKAMEDFKSVFGDKCLFLSAGSEIQFGFFKCF